MKSWKITQNCEESRFTRRYNFWRENSNVTLSRVAFFGNLRREFTEDFTNKYLFGVDKLLNRAWSPCDVGNAKRKERGSLWYMLSYYGYGIDQKISILWSQLTMCNPFDLLSTSMLKAVQFILQKENHKRRIKKTDQKCAAQKYEYIR